MLCSCNFAQMLANLIFWLFWTWRCLCSLYWMGLKGGTVGCRQWRTASHQASIFWLFLTAAKDALISWEISQILGEYFPKQGLSIISSVASLPAWQWQELENLVHFCANVLNIKWGIYLWIKSLDNRRWKKLQYYYIIGLSNMYLCCAHLEQAIWFCSEFMVAQRL